MRRLPSILAAISLLAQPVFASGFSSTATAGGGSGTVTSVAVTTANGVSGTVANPTTTPAISVSLGAITPSSVAASGTVTGSNFSGSHSGTSSGTNTGDQTITLTGDVTGTGTGSFAATIASGAITTGKMANLAATSLLGNATGSSASPSAIGLGPSFTFSGSTLYGAADHPGYVSGNWYSTVRGETVAAGLTFATGSIRLIPFTISKPVTPSALGVRITTLAASGNFQLAIYANNATTGHPTGTALCTTPSISTASTGTVSGTATCSGALTPGTYWEAINEDASAGGVAIYQTISNSELLGAYLIGSATLANVSSGGTIVQLALSVTQTFGTWPDLTSGSFTEVATASSALVFLKAT